MSIMPLVKAWFWNKLVFAYRIMWLPIGAITLVSSKQHLIQSKDVLTVFSLSKFLQGKVIAHIISARLVPSDGATPLRNSITNRDEPTQHREYVMDK